MGVNYELVNRTKRERISFAHIPSRTMRELAGNPVPAAVTTWYLLQNRGDEIAFMSDTDGEWPFAESSVDERFDYADVTDVVVQQLLVAKILKDEGITHYSENEPEVYERLLRNVWDKDDI